MPIAAGEVGSSHLSQKEVGSDHFSQERATAIKRVAPFFFTREHFRHNVGPVSQPFPLTNITGDIELEADPPN